MASTAALTLHPRLQPTTVPPGPRRPARPSLRLIEGGRLPAARARRATYLRRRILAATLVVALAAALVLSASAVLAGTAGGGGPSAAAGTVSASGVAAGTHIVAPGDTLWSIAAAAAPDVDVRITVDRIAELNGRAPLVVGQRLLLPG